MAIRCAQSIAAFAKEEGISPDYIVPGMERPELFAREAADVAVQAVEEGVARLTVSWQEVYDQALADIEKSQQQYRALEASGFIEAVPQEMIQEALLWALETKRSK
jgi:malate dehydrogenase (oxaloacetate-decarboxylating)